MVKSPIKDLDYLSNPYYKQNPEMFERLRDLALNHSRAIVVKLNSKCTRKEYRSYADLREWVEKSVSVNFPEKFRLINKCNWILHGRTEFPKCRICGKAEDGYVDKQIKINEDYSQWCSVKCMKADPLYWSHVRQGCMDSFGYPSTFDCPEIRERAHQAILRDYGVDYAMQNPDIAAKSAAALRSLCKDPKYLESVNKKSQATSFRNHGVKNPTQCRAIRLKQICKYTYEGLNYDSALEIKTAIYLKDHDIKFEYQPDAQFEYVIDGKIGKYNPDFKIICGNKSFYADTKGDQFFKPDGTMYMPFRHRTWSDEKYDFMCRREEAKHQCMITNGVVILRQSSPTMKTIIKYVDQKYGRDYCRQFRNAKRN